MTTLTRTSGIDLHVIGFTDGGAPTDGDFRPGEVVQGSDGWYLCYKGGSPGSWIGLGATIQVVDTELSALAALNAAANKLPYYTSATAAALADFSAAGRALVDDADAAAQRTTLGLAIGTNVQAWDADLDAIAALVSAANKLPYSTGAQTWALADLTAAGRALIDDATAAAQLTTLGVSAFIQTVVDDVDAATARATLGAPRVPASPTAYTQTYATADATVPTATVAAVATTASGLASYGYTQAQADAIPVAINALVADSLQNRKLLNALIDSLQAAGIAT